MVDFEVAVLRTRDAAGTAAAIAALARRAGPSASGPAAAPAPPRPGKAGLTLPERQRFVLEGLPGVSEATSRRLLAHFGSVRALAHASLEEIAAVDGVGRKTAERVFEVLRAPYPPDG
jgi:ERCC4-type nuclease